MIAAIYDRKSTDENGADADAERRAEGGTPMKKERKPRRARGSGSVVKLAGLRRVALDRVGCRAL